MNITDLIAQEILAMIKRDGGKVKIQRNELANQIGCVPSQINYVITHRFTKEQGYLVESRRGGGGFIQIVKVEYTDREALFHLLQSIGDSIDEHSTRIILQNLHHDNIITKRDAKLISAAVLDRNFHGLPEEVRLCLRANILKNMLLSTV